MIQQIIKKNCNRCNPWGLEIKWPSIPRTFVIVSIKLHILEKKLI